MLATHLIVVPSNFSSAPSLLLWLAEAAFSAAAWALNSPEMTFSASFG